MRIAQETDILLIVDLQNDFMPNGALPVPDGDQTIPIINDLLKAHFRHAVATQDWHTANHISFASQHPGKNPFDIIDLPYGAQTLWPDHCVQNTPGAALHAQLDTSRVECIIRKGFRQDIDSYSAFRENDQRTITGLDGYLRARGFNRVFIAGLARGYCTDFSAADAASAGYETFVIDNACRGITPEATTAQTSRLVALGVRFIDSSDLN